MPRSKDYIEGYEACRKQVEAILTRCHEKSIQDDISHKCAVDTMYINPLTKTWLTLDIMKAERKKIESQQFNLGVKTDVLKKET